MQIENKYKKTQRINTEQKYKDCLYLRASREPTVAGLGKTSETKDA